MGLVAVLLACFAFRASLGFLSLVPVRSFVGSFDLSFVYFPVPASGDRDTSFLWRHDLCPVGFSGRASGLRRPGLRPSLPCRFRFFAHPFGTALRSPFQATDARTGWKRPWGA